MKKPRTNKEWLAAIRKMIDGAGCRFISRGKKYTAKAVYIFPLFDVPYLKCDNPSGGTTEIPLTSVEKFI